MPKGYADEPTRYSGIHHYLTLPYPHPSHLLSRNNVFPQAVGAIAKLVHVSGKEQTVNVEYNQLDPLLRATGFTYLSTPFHSFPTPTSPLSLLSHTYTPYQYTYQRYT